MPSKFAVLACNSKLTVALLAVTFAVNKPDAAPMFPTLALPMLLIGAPEKFTIPVPAGAIIKLPFPAVLIVKSLPVLAP